MAIEEFDDLVSQAPPAKRARLNSSSQSAKINDMDDFYNTASTPTVLSPNANVSAQIASPAPPAKPAFGGIPGLGQLGNAPRASEQVAEIPVQRAAVEEVMEASANMDANIDMSGLGEAPVTETRVEIESKEQPVADKPTEILPQPTNEKFNEEVFKSLYAEMEGVEQVPVEEESTEMLPQPLSEQIAQAAPANLLTEMEGVEDAQGVPKIPSAMDQEESLLSGPQVASSSADESRPITHALEALLGGLDSPKYSDPEDPPTAEEPAADKHPEWEVDSSPIESSDDSSSDDSSSEEESDDEANAYKLLSPEEQARILMEGDGGSDDEGGPSKGKGPGEQLRTKNEVPEEVVPKPDVQITAEMKIEELGVVETMVENIILIKAKTSGEYRALETGSVLCLEDRSVIGVVSETLGRVQQPLYTVRFTNAGEIAEAGVFVGTKIYYPEEHANYALTQVLRNYKGSDASNLHDEEVGDEEVEFSDDEAEAEHKRKLKQKRLEKRGGKLQQSGGGRGGYGGHPLKQEQSSSNGAGGLNYDDAEDDGPYKPLARPTGFANTIGHSEAPQENSYAPGQPNRGGRGDFRGRGRGDRGRGDRGRGRGDRGRGSRGGFQNQDRNGYSAPTQRPNSSYGSNQNSSQSPGVPPNPNNTYATQQNNQYNPQQPVMWPQFPQVPGFPNMPSWPMMPNMPIPPPSGMPTGAFINPAFFNGQFGAQNWGQQPPQPPGNKGDDGRGGSSKS